MTFLIVYGAVSLGHLRVRHETGAATLMLVIAVALNAGLFRLLLWHTIDEGSVATRATLLGLLALSFVFENVYGKATGRTLKLEAAPAPPWVLTSAPDAADRGAKRGGFRLPSDCPGPGAVSAKAALVVGPAKG